MPLGDTWKQLIATLLHSSLFTMVSGIKQEHIQNKDSCTEDSWESLAQQGDQTSQFLRKSNLNTHLKDWCWSWSSNIFWLPDAKSWLTGKDSDAGKEWRQEEKGTTEHEMVGWHQLNGHEFEQALGVGEGQGSLACCMQSMGSQRLSEQQQMANSVFCIAESNTTL